MRTIILSVIFCAVLSGCMSSPPAAAVNWTIRCESSSATGRAAAPEGAEALRLLQVTVRAPYDGSRLAVLRPDGSLAFDAYNVFAAQPASLMKGAAEDVLSASGRYSVVLPSSTSALTPLSAEISVSTLALDCREDGRRDALVALSLVIVRGREIVSVETGEAAVALNGDMDISAAFSAAFTTALEKAIGTGRE